jgi:6-phosphogluconate dehydrogenase
MMNFGIYGLGRMGQAIAHRLLRQGHRIHVFNRSPEAAATVVEAGARGAESLEDLVRQLEQPRCVWLMLPAGEPTDEAIVELSELLAPGDVLIDGGNSYWQDAVKRAAMLEKRGIAFLDVGTSGGVHGLERGFCLMVGGSLDAAGLLDPIFQSLAPHPTPRDRDGAPEEEFSTYRPGFVRTGPPGSGHFVKMVHNGIEYGMMQAIAEGFEFLASAGSASPSADRPFVLKLDQIAEAWRSSSVISSWLVDLAAQALQSDPTLSAFTGSVEDSGEGRWMLHEAIERQLPTTVLASALFTRFESRLDARFGNQLLSALRKGFGGHIEPPKPA